MKITLIGSGNVSTILAKKITEAGHYIMEIVERGFHPILESDLYIIAITDSALYGIHKWLKLQNKLVVHTAGSVSKDVLKKVSRNYGVLYPLQSLRKDMHVVPEIPFLVDGNTPDDVALIKDFAETISSSVRIADDELRMKMHLAAVFVNNFVNHLYVIAEQYCEKEGLDFTQLRPLIEETTRRLEFTKAADAQTGPAARNDKETIRKHLKLLKKEKELRKMYELFTEGIAGRNRN